MKEKIEIGDLIVNIYGDIGIVENIFEFEDDFIRAIIGTGVRYKIIDSKEEKKISKLITTDIGCVSKFYGDFFVKY